MLAKERKNFSLPIVYVPISTKVCASCTAREKTSIT